MKLEHTQLKAQLKDIFYFYFLFDSYTDSSFSAMQIF